MVHRLFLTIFLILCFSANVLADEKILIAAASDLNSAMNAICHAFEKSNPDIKTEVSYGSSGNFFAQIKQGAPYDIFFSADSSYPMRLEEEGLAVKELKRFYAVGRIVLWIPKTSTLDITKGLKIVLQQEFKKLAIANPRHAPYGRAAEETLRYYGLWDKVQGKLVFGENVSQTAQFVQTGAADAGIIALSTASSLKMANDGNYWIIPTETYSKLEQVYTVLQRGKDKSSVKAFLEYIQGEKGKKILFNYGFIVP
ncbi:MAG: molybdate ABC transporter substrate-binding protein [Planctomycetes bacterium GWF2_39_10]|nr:MAG: molybdate ABC transporter substrate-binding protein [Planctomycetes bacterium GWA2_39_15]OHB43036.1 MAG: molybdate ABC transporter substrate-binding protein [Planctomycetes bacterium GWC2_39_26]OHB51581.1 MAG: molybdate ABC transporter substrate-binding protein [Planctomycetes bacterium GWF2_39_10]OHC00915.1 MAG: molybdate ABC transporter substrate-binding protein [Planctomycetes bacterium RIFCSPLOWO2_12_FULL_39_13]